MIDDEKHYQTFMVTEQTVAKLKSDWQLFLDFLEARQDDE